MPCILINWQAKIQGENGAQSQGTLSIRLQSSFVPHPGRSTSPRHPEAEKRSLKMSNYLKRLFVHWSKIVRFHCKVCYSEKNITLKVEHKYQTTPYEVTKSQSNRKFIILIGTLLTWWWGIMPRTKSTAGSQEYLGSKGCVKWIVCLKQLGVLVLGCQMVQKVETLGAIVRCFFSKSNYGLLPTTPRKNSTLI